MKIKIICGTYGHRPNPNESRVVRKDKSSEPFEVADDEARRLVSLGVAEICDKAVSSDVVPDHVSLGGISAEQIMNMEYNQMKKLAKGCSIDAKGKKDELQERLLDALDSGSAREDDDDGQDDEESDDADQDSTGTEGEEPPELTAQLPG